MSVALTPPLASSPQIHTTSIFQFLDELTLTQIILNSRNPRDAILRSYVYYKQIDNIMKN